MSEPKKARFEISKGIDLFFVDLISHDERPLASHMAHTHDDACQWIADLTHAITSGADTVDLNEVTP